MQLKRCVKNVKEKLNVVRILQVQCIMEHENLPLAIFSDVKDLHTTWENYTLEREKARKVETEQDENTSSSEEM